MTTYTIEQFQKAWSKAKYKDLNAVIAELQKPAWTPKVGQWVVGMTEGKAAFEWKEGYSMPCNVRPLTASEIGIERFEYTTSRPNKACYQAYNEAIDHVNKTLFGEDND